MSSSGAASLAASLSGVQAATAALGFQASVQRGVLDLQQQLIEQLLAQFLSQMGIGANLNLTA